jgi:hypothetical protein
LHVAIWHGREDQELSFFRVARDVAFAERILDQHDGSGLAPASLAIAGFKLDVPG